MTSVQALLLTLSASAAQAQVTPSTPIVVTGHPWAPFVSPMGEPYRAHSATDDTLADWFNRADRDHDGVLTEAEMVADADRFFALLDTDRDGELGPDEIARYEDDIAPEIQVMSPTRPPPGERGRVALQDDDRQPGNWREHRQEDMRSLGMGGSLQGAGRYGLLNMPEPVAAADTDFNRSITRQEFRAAAVARFQLLDKARRGGLTLAQLEAMPHVPQLDRAPPNIDEKALDTRIGDPLPMEPNDPSSSSTPPGSER
ncbi:MAG TPA: EF-hand domain-containing protein [Sphingomicrobium sp.]|nr:EF-hand domain-containing protein [Sphingomicrobium sp.]